jgi:SEC-C motif domain protein
MKPAAQSTPSNCPCGWPNPPDLRWLGLDVRKHVQVDEAHATVEFVARSKQAGRATRLHEISRFERLDGRWTYVDGIV